MTETPQQEWPRDIWMAERDDHDQGVVMAVLSEHATVARWAGDPDRDNEFHRYIDADIHESLERYCKAQSAAERDARSKLEDALRAKDAAMETLFDLLRANSVDYSHLIS